MTKLYTKRDMYLNESVGNIGINLYTLSKEIVDPKTAPGILIALPIDKLNVNFTYETDGDDEKIILEAGEKFLETAEVGDAFRWQVDPMSLQYCELVRIN